MKKIKITPNFGLKIIALIFSIILWVFAVNIDDPVVSKTFRDVSITMLNEDVVTNKGKVYQIVDDVKTTTVTVYAKRSVLSGISEEDVVATADLSKMETDTYLVPIEATVSGADIVSAETSPNNLEITISDVTKNTFPISVSVTGTTRDGYVVGETTVSPENIEISGSELLIDTIQKAVARIDVSGMSESGTVEAELILYDSNNNVISQNQLKNNLGDDGLSVYVQILNTKDVDLEFKVSGEPADGYVFAGWSSVPATVQVSGTEEALEDLDTIVIPASEVDIDGMSEKQEVTVDISPYLPDDVELVDETATNVVVTVLIELEGARTIEFPLEGIEIKNLADDLQVTFETTDDLVLHFTGAEDVVNLLDITDAVSIDLESYTTAGTYEVPVNIETASEVTLTDDPTVTVILTEKEESQED